MKTKWRLLRKVKGVPLLGIGSEYELGLKCSLNDVEGRNFRVDASMPFFGPFSFFRALARLLKVRKSFVRMAKSLMAKDLMEAAKRAQELVDRKRDRRAKG